jgi:hypothetical protein
MYQRHRNREWVAVVYVAADEHGCALESGARQRLDTGDKFAQGARAVKNTAWTGGIGETSTYLARAPAQVVLQIQW